MNTRKPLLLTLFVTIALLGLVLFGCEQRDEHAGHDHSESKTCCGADPSKCCASKAVEAAKEAAKTCCGEDPSKCCASKAVEAVEGAVKEAAKGCCGEDPTKCCGSKATE